MFFVYILQSLRTGELYKGFTDNLERRLEEHFQGKVLFTRGKLPLKLIHVEICSSRLEARKLKKFFKSGFGRKVLAEILLGKWRNR